MLCYSPFGTPKNSDENLDYESYWYMGSTETFRANVAFSLYGILQGRQDKGCTEATYINSFFTTHGVQTFIEAMRLSGYLGGEGTGNSADDIFYAGGDGTPGFSSVCTRDIEDDGYEADAFSYGNGYGLKNAMGKAGTQRFPNAVSYTLGCYDGVFRLESFQGATCARPYFTASLEVYQSATASLANMGCAAIYDSQYSGLYSTSNYFDDNGNENQGQGGNYFEEDEADNLPTISYPLDLLKYSQSCSIRLYPDMCPDPHGKLKKYVEDFHRAMRLVVVYKKPMETQEFHSTPPVFLLTCGFIMLGMAVFFHIRHRNDPIGPALARKTNTTSGPHKHQVTSDTKKEQVTNETQKEEVTSEIQKEQVTNEIRKDQVPSTISILGTKSTQFALAAAGTVVANISSSIVSNFFKRSVSKASHVGDREEFEVGTFIFLRGLKGASHLNGCSGRIGSITSASFSKEKRYLVILDVVDSQFPELSVKYENLEYDPRTELKQKREAKCWGVEDENSGVSSLPSEMSSDFGDLYHSNSSDNGVKEMLMHPPHQAHHAVASRSMLSGPPSLSVLM